MENLRLLKKKKLIQRIHRIFVSPTLSITHVKKLTCISHNSSGDDPQLYKMDISPC